MLRHEQFRLPHIPRTQRATVPDGLNWLRAEGETDDDLACGANEDVNVRRRVLARRRVDVHRETSSAKYHRHARNVPNRLGFRERAAGVVGASG